MPKLMRKIAAEDNLKVLDIQVIDARMSRGDGVTLVVRKEGRRLQTGGETKDSGGCG